MADPFMMRTSSYNYHNIAQINVNKFMGQLEHMFDIAHDTSNLVHYPATYY